MSQASLVPELGRSHKKKEKAMGLAWEVTEVGRWLLRMWETLGLMPIIT